MDARVIDDERYPTLTDAGARMLSFLREHPHAPIFRNESGNRLTAEDVALVRADEAEVRAARVDWSPGTPPPWIAAHIARCYAQVPFFRRQGAAPPRLEDVPPTSRADLARDIAAHFPDDIPVHRLINFRTTGTTGHPLLIASHARVAAGYLAFHKRALDRWDIELRHGRGQVGVVLLGFQRHCFTYVSVTPTMDESGLAKLNLHPADWRSPDDRARYLDALAPEVLAGDPLSYAELLTLPVALRPRAILSTSMSLTAGLRAALEQRFGCPVLDLYSLNEAGPVGVYDERAGGHVLLQPRLYVEILDSSGHPQPPGVRGEIALTGGFNFCLPLLRYRTGDQGALSISGREPVLIGLEGRAPVRFRTSSGDWINNIDVTHVLGHFALARFALHQASDGAFTLRLRGGEAEHRSIQLSLLELLGQGAVLTIAPFEEDGADKGLQYTSALSEAAP